MGNCQGSEKFELPTNLELDIEFFYFGIYNRGEPMRMLLNHACVSFKDTRVADYEWMKLKPTMPNG